MGMFSQNAKNFCLNVTIDIKKVVSQCSRKQKILGLGSQMTTDDWYLHTLVFQIEVQCWTARSQTLFRLRFRITIFV